MRRKSYFYNQVQNLRRFFRRQVKRVICMAAVSATMLTSVPFVTYTDVYAKGQTTREQMEALSIPNEKVTTYDLSNDASLISEKKIVDYYGRETTIKVIEINITENGNYVITGSNRIDDTLIDTHIIVAEGVKANITFDGAKIENSTRYVSYIGFSVQEIYNPVFPVMDILGDANIFVKENSELISAAAEENPVIRVTGEMTVEESDAALKLTVGKEVDESGKRVVNSDMYAVSGYADGVRSRGSMTVKGGNLDITGGINRLERFTMTGGTITSTCKNMEEAALVANDITIAGGNCSIDASYYPKAVIFEGKRNIQFSAGTIEVNHLDGSTVRGIVTFSSPNTRITGGKLKLDDQIVIQDTMDAYGNMVNLFDLTGLPKNQNVAAINGYPVEGLQTTSDGELKGVALPYSSNLIQMENGNLYKYDYLYEDEKETMVADENSDPAVYEVPLKLVEEDGTLIEQKKVYLPEGFEMQDYFDGSNFYQYFNEGGEQYPQVTIGNDDALILKKTCTVTLDGKPYSGDVLPEGSMYVWKTEDSYGLWYYTFYPGDPVPSGKNIALESVPSVQKEGKWYVSLKSKEDIDRIKIMTELDPTINILLETDLDFSGDESVYSLLGTVYYGVFDGNRHTISNAKLYVENWYAITERNYGTIKNVHFENITNQTSKMSCRTGVICEENYGTVENCSVKNSVIKTLARNYNEETGEVSPYDKAKDYSALVGGNFGTIRGCFASGVNFEGEGVTYPLTHEFPNSIIENTYYEAEEETRDGTARTKGQFASGEVCSLLNQGVTDGSQYWYQNVDNDAVDDVPVADDSHGTVYEVYVGCSMRGYSNSALYGTPSHEVDYTVKDNVLTGVCKADPSHTVTMTLTAEDAVCDGTEHKAVLNKTYSDAWGNAEVDAEIVYTRDGETTTDLTSAGMVKASVTAGGKMIEVTYTIKVAATPTASPAASPSATPSASPAATPTVSPAVTPSASPKTTPTANPTATPAATLPPASDPVVLPPANPPADDKSTPAPDNKPVIEPGATKAPAAAKTPQAVGSKIKIKKRGTFKVIKSSGKTPEVELTKLFLSKKDKYISIPKTVKVNGVTYKVTAIAKRAFAGNKNLKAVVIGKNVKEIGVMAFYNCPNLKTVTIKSTQLKAKTVGAKAFAKIYEKASVQIPKAKKAAYTKWLKDRGIGGKQKIVTD